MPSKPLKIKVSDWSKYPGGRFRRDGKFSGEEFRDDVLYPKLRAAIEAGDGIIVNLDGTAGYASSFLEEVFGGLSRKHKITSEDFARALKVEATDPLYVPFLHLALRYFEEAAAAAHEAA